MSNNLDPDQARHHLSRQSVNKNEKTKFSAIGGKMVET